MSGSLGALQQRFLAAVLEGAPLADAVEPAGALDFYRGTVAATLRAVLAAAYPAAARLVGEPFFAEAARAYAAHSPSHSGDLHRFGDGFAAFLERYAPAQTLAYLPDVARLEWAVHECLHASDTRAIDFAQLAAMPEAGHGSLRVRLAPAVRLIRSTWPVLAIWEANLLDRDGTPERFEGADCVLVRRPGAEVIAERLDARDWGFLEALAAGHCLERAIDALAERRERLPALLAQWCAGGVIASFEPGEAHA